MVGMKNIVRYRFCFINSFLLVSILGISVEGQSEVTKSKQPHFSIPQKVLASKHIKISTNSTSVTYSIDQLRNSSENLRPGTLIEFAPGVYSITSPIYLKNLSHITIKGTTNTIFEGVKGPERPQLKRQPCNEKPCLWKSGPWKPQYCNFDGFAIFKVVGSKNIRLSNFNIRNAWPNGITITNSQDINIDKIDVRGGTNAVFAQSLPNYSKGHLKTRKITISNSTWIQDEELWSYRTWQHVHHGEQNYLNGAFFQGRNIAGNVAIENNKIKDAFNAIRIKVSSKLCPTSKSCDYNRNVFIKNNKFYRISDNVIEPETYASNWKVTDNLVVDTHAAFSFDGVHGNNFYMANNIVRIESKPRTRLSQRELYSLSKKDRDPHNGGCIFKLKYVGDIKNFVIENNEFHENYTPFGQKGKKFTKGTFPQGTILKNNQIIGSFRATP